MGSSFFTYDARSRLKTGLGQSFDYDRWGNLNPLGVNPMTNRIKAGGYDSRGNMVRSGTQTYRYDELSRQVAVDGGKERYLYDGAGERIARVTSTAPGLSLYTITPCRIRDTRDPPAMLAPFVPFTVQVTGGPCGIPPEAEALAGNLTALGSSQAGFILAQPAGTAGLDTSTINFAAGQTRANNFNLGLSTAGRIELTAPTPVHAIVDASGYYAYPGAASQETWNLTLRDEANRLSTDYTVTSLATTRKRNYFYFGNLLVATREEGSPVAWRYYASDHLGTPRVVTGSTGSVLESHTYRPFGEEIGGTFGLQPLKFAAMERDVSSGNDYNHARFQSPSLGRFLSPDVLGGKPEDPQSWNRYAYALNNPLTLVDPDGKAALKFEDYVFIVRETALQTLDRLAFLTAQPLLRVGTGILNNSPTELALGASELLLADAAGGIARSLAGSAASERTRLRLPNPYAAVVENRALQNAVDALYKPGQKVAGGLAGAIRVELAEGVRVGGRSHITAGYQRIANLTDILKTQNLSAADRAVALRELRKLQEALKRVNVATEARR